MGEVAQVEGSEQACERSKAAPQRERSCGMQLGIGEGGRRESEAASKGILTASRRIQGGRHEPLSLTLFITGQTARS